MKKNDVVVIHRKTVGTPMGEVKCINGGVPLGHIGTVVRAHSEICIIRIAKRAKSKCNAGIDSGERCFKNSDVEKIGVL